ncbi:MAG: alpha/beta fold hydrolase [Planctomycetes bacterium]|nr:alpha/beta fold hydrolase [Planctomycetota bacterium]MCC7398127.1 alpha/beta fold hydrolase [Planctomycetota bacterium]
MTFPLLAALVFVLVTLVPGALVGGLLAWRGRATATFWRRLGWLHAALLPLHLFVTFPAALGLLGSRGLSTRPDERDYLGPVGGERHLIASSDGVTLRAFRLPATKSPPVATAVLVHGLFRCAKELEPVATMLREQGCDCWLVELRNFGGSSRAPFTGGLHEADDVVAAVRYARERGGSGRPLLLFGVSFGTVAVSLALPRLDGVGGVVLDAPIDDLVPASQRLLDFNRPDRRSWLHLLPLWRSLVLSWLEFWSDFDATAVSPSEVLATLPVDLPVLLVGAGQDDRAPPDTVQRLFDRLPTLPDRKRLWLEPGSGHGRVFLDHPADYRARLAWLLGCLRR